MRFRTTVELGGKTATGLVVPPEVVAALGAGQRPRVLVTLGGHQYRSTVAVRGGRHLIALSAQNRAAAGVGAGQTVEVELALDTEDRSVPIPADLDAELSQDASARDFFTQLSFTHRKEWVRWIEEAKRPETRSARLAKTLDALRAGRRTR